MQPPARPQASLTVFEGIAVIVAVVIGIGIFRTPSVVAANVGSEAAFMAVWVVGGLITLVGALCYAELGSTYPSAGGEYRFLTRAFGTTTGLFFAWARVSVIQTGAIAALAFVYGDYAQHLLGLGPHGASVHAALAVVVFTALNVSGKTPSATLQKVFSVLALLAVAVVALAGFTSPAEAAEIPASPIPAGAALGMAMVFVLLTYGGWNEVAYLSGEMRDARRTMARTLIIGVVVITAAYIVINLAYLNTLGLDGLRASDAAGADLMVQAAGDTGAVFLSLIVCIAALSSVNGTILTGGRAYYALGQDVPALRGLGMWDTRGDTPTNGLLTQGAVTLALIGFGAMTREGFQSMVEYTAPVFWFFMLLTSVSLFVLRHRNPDRPRGFSVPLYPVLPAVFSLTCLALMYSSLAYTGAGALVGILVLLAGIPLLVVERKMRRTTPAE
ncbi:MAG: amino acid permease [Rhodospirillaceae bacterium]